MYGDEKTKSKLGVSNDQVDTQLLHLFNRLCTNNI